MKRFLLFLCAISLWTTVAVRAQTPEAAAAIADKQAEEERYKRLASQLEDLQVMLNQQAKKIGELTSQLASFREEQGRHEGKAVSVEALKQLADDVQEVDKKRIADNKLVRDELAKILKAVAEAPPAPSGGRAKPPVELKSQHTSEGEPKGDGKLPKTYEYVVQKDDTLSAIAAAYRTQGIKVSVDDILKANPGLKPEQMRIGQKITVPGPAN